MLYGSKGCGREIPAGCKWHICRYCKCTLFDGRQVIEVTDLADAGVRTQYKADKTSLHEQERDTAKYWLKNNVRLAFLGLENQTNTDKTMPLRVIGYDGVIYGSQLLKDDKEDTARESFYPVITMVLYFGEKPWNGPTSLVDYLEISEELNPL